MEVLGRDDYLSYHLWPMGGRVGGGVLETLTETRTDDTPKKPHPGHLRKTKGWCLRQLQSVIFFSSQEHLLDPVVTMSVYATIFIKIITVPWECMCNQQFTALKWGQLKMESGIETNHFLGGEWKCKPKNPN